MDGSISSRQHNDMVNSLPLFQINAVGVLDAGDNTNLRIRSIVV